MGDQRVTYTFGPLERRGLTGALGLGQVTVLALGAVSAVIALDLTPSATGALALPVILAIAAGLAFWPVAGATPTAWVPVLAAFAGRRLSGATRFRSTTPLDGVAVSGVGSRLGRARAPRVTPPPPLTGVSLVALGEPERSIGALSERGGRRLTTVLACRVTAFALLDHDAQERRLARWGNVLSGASSTAIHRLQWIERTAPAQGDALARWVHEQHDPAVPLRGSAMVESYLELISAGTRVAQEHEVLIAVQIDGRRVSRRGPGSPAQAALESADRVARTLEAAEVVVLGALGPGPLAATLRTAFDPYARAELITLDARSTPDHGRPVQPWPIGTAEDWDRYACDGAVHATFWISGWPQVEVSPLFMDTLLGPSETVRTVSVTFEPLALDRSTREAEAAVTRDRADRDVRARFGQSETARQRQAVQATMRREAELAAGHGEVRLAGFITVSGRDADELRRGCEQVIEQAARARLQVRRLYGQQADAFSFTLPLARGLR